MSNRKSRWILAGAALGVGLAVAVLSPWLFTPSERAEARSPAPIVTAEPLPSPRGEPVPVLEESQIAARPNPSPALSGAAAVEDAEPALMRELREVARRDPARAIELAREGDRRFPNGPDAPERASILIHALAAADRPSEARGEAEDMVNRLPDSDWVREIEQFTGAHRHRNVEVGPDGRLRYIASGSCN